MQYGHFDNKSREYVIDKIDLPTSWTNYLGVDDMCAVVNHTAGGYSFYKSPEHHRITRFRPNGVPMDYPGYYIYIRDNDSSDYWTVSYQPVGKNPKEAEYSTRFGMSYNVYQCDYSGIHATEKLCVPRRDPVLLIDTVVRNDSTKERHLSVFSYMEFSFHEISIDNQNFQMSLYCAGSSYDKGVIEEDLYYEKGGFSFLTSDFEPNDYDTIRDEFIGGYRTEKNPVAVENGHCSRTCKKGGNHCGVLKKDIVLKPGQEKRLVFIMGDGDRSTGIKYKDKYSKKGAVDRAYHELEEFWNERFNVMSVQTPSEAMNTMQNIWTLYQSEINVIFSRFASFIEVGGRTGLGFRDTSQDAMTIPHTEPGRCRDRILQLMKGLTSTGYGLHLFDPADFDGSKKDIEPSPTIKGAADKTEVVHGIEGACSDDALWLIPAVTEYIKETGDTSILEIRLSYADTYFDDPAFSESVYEHMKRILDFTGRERGSDGICLGLRADWNDCLNLGGGESAMTTFLYYYALNAFLELLSYMADKNDNADSLTGNDDAEDAPLMGKKIKKDILKYTMIREEVREASERELFDETGNWYIRGITATGRKIGSAMDEEGRVHLESNSWAVLSGEAKGKRAEAAVLAMDKYLYTPYGLRLVTPCYTKVDDEIGFVTRVYPGLKENGSIFSHPNPWAWGAACKIGRGDIAMKFYDAICPCLQNDKIDIRKAEPYSTCQFVTGPDHSDYGEARHPFMTGSGGWSYYSAGHYILGIRPDFDGLIVDPCIDPEWKEYKVNRRWRGALYNISIENPNGVMSGVMTTTIDGQVFLENNSINRGVKLPIFPEGEEHDITVIMG